ncbi:MAG: replication-associated recombination protein A [Ruminococcaceae bacterium]|nr:replication-associated recombination protein A [Oscillospiraceae bacterium]
MEYRPLADRMRPQKLDQIAGQRHLVARDGILTKALSRAYLSNMVFYGPPGTGKTSCANIVASIADMRLYKLNATTASTADVRQVLQEADGVLSGGGMLLYIDEIQYFNKKQQQTLLEYLENGKITMIASTTENPYLYIYNAILSRSMVFEFKPVAPQEILPVLRRGLCALNEEGRAGQISASEEVLFKIASAAGGDVRRALNILESSYYLSDGNISAETVAQMTPRVMGSFDKDGTVHYDLLSCLQKSVRGSDPDAAVFYLARILEGGDLQGACRRLQVMASEDVGLAYPMAITVVMSLIESAMKLGMPEARIPLAEAAIFLATCPKSNSAYMAYDKALADIEKGKGLSIPPHLRPVNEFAGYLYPHDYPNHYVSQQYLPDDVKGNTYYRYGENKTEQAAKKYWELIRSETAAKE